MFFSSYVFERKFWNCLYLFRENRDRGTTGERGTFSVGFKDWNK